MDRFSRSLLAAAAEAGIATITLSRHVPSLRRSIHSHDEVLLLANCRPPEGQVSGDHLMLLTRRRLVVTKESKVLGRVRVDVDAGLEELHDVHWSADPGVPGVDFTCNIADGTHRFWMDARYGKRVWRLDALLATHFRRPTVSVAALRRAWDI